MKKTTVLISALTLALAMSTGVRASTFEQAVKEASMEIDKAKALNYEWRDSRKLLKKAKKLHKEGKTKKAMKLVAKAREQGKLAVIQAEAQSSVSGPHQ